MLMKMDTSALWRWENVSPALSQVSLAPPHHSSPQSRTENLSSSLYSGKADVCPCLWYLHTCSWLLKCDEGGWKGNIKCPLGLKVQFGWKEKHGLGRRETCFPQASRHKLVICKQIRHPHSHQSQASHVVRVIPDSQASYILVFSLPASLCHAGPMPVWVLEVFFYFWALSEPIFIYFCSVLCRHHCLVLCVKNKSWQTRIYLIVSCFRKDSLNEDVLLVKQCLSSVGMFFSFLSL